MKRILMGRAPSEHPDPAQRRHATQRPDGHAHLRSGGQRQRWRAGPRGRLLHRHDALARPRLEARPGPATCGFCMWDPSPPGRDVKSTVDTVWLMDRPVPIRIGLYAGEVIA